MSSSPKIILLGPASPYRGGIADTQEALHKALKKLGVEVELITFKTLYPQLLFPGKSPFGKMLLKNNPIYAYCTPTTLCFGGNVHNGSTHKKLLLLWFAIGHLCSPVMVGT